MRKTSIMVALMIGVGVSASAFAAPILVTTASETVSATDNCVLLANDVTVGVSSNVTGGYQCNETTGIIMVAACHAGGSRDTGVICAYYDDDGDATTPMVLNSSGCTDDMTKAPAKPSTIPNYKAFSASSAGGAMTEQELTGRCDQTSLPALTFWTK